MTQHTAGPWDFQNRGSLHGESGRVVIVDANQTSLAKLKDLSGVSYANARLIAAAPELLEKGNRVIAAWLNAEPGCTIAAISAELGNLREAIAKAETI